MFYLLRFFWPKRNAKEITARRIFFSFNYILSAGLDFLPKNLKKIEIKMNF